MKKLTNDNLGIFYTCFTEIDSVNYAIDTLRLIYDKVPIFLVSDGGADYSFIMDKYENILCLREHDSRGFVPEIPPEKYKEDKWQYMIEKSVLDFLDRVKRAIDYCGTEYILVMEPDVLVRGFLSVPEDANLLGSRLNQGLSEELKSIMRSINGAIEVNCWGATPAIFKSKKFIEVYENIKNKNNILKKICFSDCRFANYDIVFPVLFGLMGMEETFNPEITECLRDPNWENNNKPLVHQFRIYYPRNNYQGRHYKEIQ